VDKRLRNQRVTDLLPHLGLALRADFEGDKKSPAAKLEKLEKKLKSLSKDEGFKEVKLHFDDEHNLWEAHFTDSQGADRIVNWQLASTPEYRQMISKYKQIGAYMEPPFVVEHVARGGSNGSEELSDAERAELEKTAKKTPKAAARARKASEEETVEKASARELFEYVLNTGQKDYSVQRYKGLGEMRADQLWETTMDPERRTLLEVKLEDIAECETIFTTLMGEDVEARRKFIEENALDVKNLDI
jgi:DNA gyrase subunit B